MLVLTHRRVASHEANRHSTGAPDMAGAVAASEDPHEFLGAAMTLILPWNESLHQPGTRQTTEAGHPRCAAAATHSAPHRRSRRPPPPA